MVGESSELYSKLYDDGLINADFGKESFAGRDNKMMLFSGESKEPERVFAEIKKKVAEVIEKGVDEKRFEMCKKAMYGKYIRMMDITENVANLLLSTHFAGTDPYELIEVIAKADAQTINKRMKECYNAERSVLSVIKAG